MNLREFIFTYLITKTRTSQIGIFILLLLCLVNKKKSKRLALPPGPPRWPIIGNLPQLGDKPHQSLFHLAQKYGPLMTLKLGTQTTVVVSSRDVAKVVLKSNDQSFSSRTVNIAARTFTHQGTSLVWSPDGPRWRLFRKICTTKIFSVSRLDALQKCRRDEVIRTIGTILEDYKQGKSVKIGEKAFMISLSLVGEMVCKKTVFEPGSSEAAEFRDMVLEVLRLLAVPNLSDLFPFLERFDLQGLNRKNKILSQRFDNIFNRIIDERLGDRAANVKCSCNEEKDFLEVMLDSVKEGDLTLENIKGTLLDLFVAGTDTTSSTIEWAMAELMRNPALMRKVQTEMDEFVGVERRMEEADIANLPYLRAVVKEVFRLHPATPLNVPRRADKCCEIDGYLVPENTQVFVNIWAIGRDPKVWKDPLTFNPDRFWESDIDYKGRDFELIPFGAGRRICIGLPLAHRLVPFVVGSLVQAFNWSIPLDNGVDIDMSEEFGLTLQKAVPLMAIPTPRCPINFYS